MHNENQTDRCCVSIAHLEGHDQCARDFTLCYPGQLKQQCTSADMFIAVSISLLNLLTGEYLCNISLCFEYTEKVDTPNNLVLFV